MAETSSGSDPISYIYGLIQDILDQLRYNSGGMREQLDRMERSIPDSAAVVTNQVYQSQIYVQDSIASVGADVGYTRSFLADTIRTEVDRVAGAQTEQFENLTSMVISGNQAILQAIVATNEHMNDLFGHLESFAGQIADRLAEALGSSIQELLGGLDAKFATLEATIERVSTNQTAVLERLDSHLTEKVDDLVMVTRKNGEIIEASLDLQTDRLIASREELQKEWIAEESANARLLAAKMGEVGGSFILGSAAIASALTAGFTSITATMVATEAKDAIKWAPIIAALTTLLSGATTLWDSVVAPILKDPENAVADIIASVVETYYRVGVKTYDKLHLDEH